MKLTALNPRFICAGGEGVTAADGALVPLREGVGVSFDCPCGYRGAYHSRCAVMFANPLSGGPTVSADGRGWRRVGETFDDLTLSPSILRMGPGGCGWYGHIINGEVITA